MPLREPWSLDGLTGSSSMTGVKALLRCKVYAVHLFRHEVLAARTVSVTFLSRLREGARPVCDACPSRIRQER